MRKTLPFIALVLWLAACSGSPRRPVEPTPAEKVAGLMGKIRDLEERVESLESNVERFDLENWRDVVPDVRSDAEELSDEIRRLRIEASDLEQDLIRAEDPGDYEPSSDPRL